MSEELGEPEAKWSQDDAILYESVQELLNRQVAQLMARLYDAEARGDSQGVINLHAEVKAVVELKDSLSPLDGGRLREIRQAYRSERGSKDVA